ncbi:hypothetical protein [Siminovitchia terrae]|nr:hypothetical protein [Siminovitchia terrae]
MNEVKVGGLWQAAFLEKTGEGFQSRIPHIIMQLISNQGLLIVLITEL